MLLLPCLAAILILSLTPVGTLLADVLAGLTGLSPSHALPLVYLIVVAGLTGILYAITRFTAREESPPSEDALLETGTWRAQGRLAFLGGATLLTGFLALAVVPAGHLQIILAGGCLALTFAPFSYVKPAWPDPLDPREDGSESDTTDSEDDPKEEAGKKLIQYRWSYRNSLVAPADSVKSASLDLVIEVAAYERFKAMAREDPTQDKRGYGVLPTYVKNGTAPEVGACVKKLKAIASEEKLPTLDTVNLVLAFVQGALDLAPEEATPEPIGYCKYPIETLIEKKGDAKNKAILAATLLRELGWDVALVVLEGVDETARVGVGLLADVRLPSSSFVEDHGRRYYFCEITHEGDSYIGEMPDAVQSKIKGAVCYRI